MVDILEALKAGKASKRGRKPKISTRVSRKNEIYYTKELLKISEELKAEGAEIIALVNLNDRMIGDAIVPSWSKKAAKLVASGVTSRVTGLAGTLAAKVVLGQAGSATDRLKVQLKNISGLDVTMMMNNDKKFDEAINNNILANTSLIKSIPKQYHSKVDRLVLTALQEGKRKDWLADEVKKLGDITDNRARLIARDQIGKIDSQIREIRQRDLGIKGYYWICRMDGRERKKHHDRHQLYFSWDNPPNDGHAGMPVNCRCEDEPAIE